MNMLLGIFKKCINLQISALVKNTLLCLQLVHTQTLVIKLQRINNIDYALPKLGFSNLF